MAHSLERRFADLAEKYGRLKDVWERSVQHRRILQDELGDANAEIRSLKRELRDRERASKNSLGKLITIGRYNAVHLRDAGDIEAYEKIEQWLDDIEATMSPVVEVKQLIDLLQGWVDAVPYDDDKVAILYMRTMKELNDILGTSPSE